MRDLSDLFQSEKGMTEEIKRAIQDLTFLAKGMHGQLYPGEEFRPLSTVDGLVAQVSNMNEAMNRLIHQYKVQLRI